MTPPPEVFISGAVEGLVDEAVANRLVRHVRAETASVYVSYGKDRLRDSAPGYNNAARFSPWLVLVDLDRDADCAPPFVRTWLPLPSPRMCFRVAVRAIEAWLMADSERLASFLRVPPRDVPPDPESLRDPKRAMVDLARRSRRQEIRADMLPRPRSGRAAPPTHPGWSSLPPTNGTAGAQRWPPAPRIVSPDA